MSLSLQYKRTLKDCSFFSTPQQTSGVDLALLLVDTLQKSGFSVSQEYIGKESSSIVGLMYITGAEPFMGGHEIKKTLVRRGSPLGSATASRISVLHQLLYH